MIAILGALLGFLGSSVPSLINYYQDKADKAQELEILRLQVSLQNQENQQSIEHLQEIGVAATAAQQEALYETYDTGIKWVDAFNGMVRPIISYAFFGIYAAIKVMQITMMDNISSYDHTHIVWTQEDQAIMCAIISYYFGSQVFHK